MWVGFDVAWGRERMGDEGVEAMERCAGHSEGSLSSERGIVGV